MDDADDQTRQAFERAAELFGLLATPIRLRIISELCEGEKNVSQLLDRIAVTQSNMSQHLNMLYRAGVVTRRRQGAQVFYRMGEGVAPLLCRAVSTQVEAGLERPAPAGSGLTPAPSA